MDALLQGTTRLTDFDAAWNVSRSGPTLRAVRTAAEKLRDRFAAGPRVVAVRTMPLTTLLYPTKYAFNSSAASPAPYVVMTHRCVLVQFLQAGLLKTLLFNPTDIDGARATPFFARLISQFGERASNLLVERFEPLETQISRFGIRAADVDYIAFDHFHTQDVRPLVGTKDGARTPRFPNATLLAPKCEWTTGTISIRTSGPGSCATASATRRPTASLSPPPISRWVTA